MVIKENGNKVKIRVYFYFSLEKPIYNISARICLTGKRTYINVCNIDGFEYRRLNSTERNSYEMSKIREHVTDEQILEAKMELWNLLKPQ